MPGKQTNEQGFRRGSGKGFGNFKGGHQKRKREQFNWEGGWNRGNNQYRKNKKHSPGFNQDQKEQA